MIYDIIIIGSGVAGLTASIYASRAKKSVLVLEDSVLGGTTATIENIENYPGYVNINGFDLIQNMYQQAINLGVNFRFDIVKKIDFNNNSLQLENDTLNYKTLIIAGGTSNKKLNIENEDKFRLKGISYCAVCDGMLYRNKKIIVITSGNTAKESIDYLYGISKNIIVLDVSDKFKSDDLKVYNNVKINKLIGGNHLESIDFDSNNDNFKIDCDGIFVVLGKETNISLYKEFLTTDKGFLVTDENMHTNIDNVFVAGDIRKKSLRQIVTACSDGAIAATEAIKYIIKNAM